MQSRKRSVKFRCIGTLNIKLNLFQIHCQTIQMMKVIVVFKSLLASGKLQHGRHLFKWGNRWNILGFNFTKRDALSSVY
jgi:hypothetical protein